MQEGDNKPNEFTLIRDYFSDIGNAYLQEQEVKLSVGDDAALLYPSFKKGLVLSVDTSLSGTHFLDSMKASDIAYRSVAIALSDLAACGATPSWFMLAISLETLDKDWLGSFRQGLIDISEEFRIPLIGGDTTKGSLSITVQTGGKIDSDNLITRNGAEVGDVIYLTGSIGEAFLALQLLKSKEKIKDNLVNSYLRPKIRIEIGKRLLGVASSAIDVSDGLVQDLNHICCSSNLAAKIFLEKIPTSLEKPLVIDTLNSGDDYEICFTTRKSQRQKILSISQETGVPITEIGEIIAGEGVQVISKKGNLVLSCTGYKHF